MDPTNAFQQQMMAQALMGTQAMPGTMPSGAMPMTAAGQRGMSGQPTTPGGMLGTSPWTPFDPNAPQGPIPPTMDPMMGGAPQMGQPNPQQPNPFQLQQPMQSYPLPEGHGSEGGAGR